MDSKNRIQWTAFFTITFLATSAKGFTEKGSDTGA
jgi:hypothetical protein